MLPVTTRHSHEFDENLTLLLPACVLVTLTKCGEKFSLCLIADRLLHGGLRELGNNPLRQRATRVTSQQNCPQPLRVDSAHLRQR
jgi:hypothetical protein